jgi:hypothetical protein
MLNNLLINLRWKFIHSARTAELKQIQSAKKFRNRIPIKINFVLQYEIVWDQGDQIGRIFAYWAIV